MHSFFHSILEDIKDEDVRILEKDNVLFCIRITDVICGSCWYIRSRGKTLHPSKDIIVSFALNWKELCAQKEDPVAKCKTSLIYWWQMFDIESVEES